MALNNSLNMPLSFNGEMYSLWKENMKIFIEGMDYDIWKAAKNSSFVPRHQFNCVLENKDIEIWTKEEKEKMNHNLKAKTIITIALDIDDFYVFLSMRLQKICGTPFK